MTNSLEGPAVLRVLRKIVPEYSGARPWHARKTDATDLALRPLAEEVRRQQHRRDSARTAKERERASKALAKAQLEFLFMYRWLRLGEEAPGLAGELGISPRRAKSITTKWRPLTGYKPARGRSQDTSAVVDPCSGITTFQKAKDIHDDDGDGDTPMHDECGEASEAGVQRKKIYPEDSVETRDRWYQTVCLRARDCEWLLGTSGRKKQRRVRAKLKHWHSNQGKPTVYVIDWREFRRVRRARPGLTHCRHCGPLIEDCRTPISHNAPVVENVEPLRTWFGGSLFAAHGGRPRRTQRPTIIAPTSLPIMPVFVGSKNPTNAYLARQRLLQSEANRRDWHPIPSLPATWPSPDGGRVVDQNGDIYPVVDTGWRVGRRLQAASLPLQSRSARVRSASAHNVPTDGAEAFLLDLAHRVGTRCQQCSRYFHECACHKHWTPQSPDPSPLPPIPIPGSLTRWRVERLRDLINWLLAELHRPVVDVSGASKKLSILASPVSH